MKLQHKADRYPVQVQSPGIIEGKSDYLMGQAKEEPKVFIGIPVQNGGFYLAQALDSVRQQNYSNWIALISDNCSTDDTREIAERYALEDSRFKVVGFDQPMSAKENFRYLLERADTDYFCWLAADDLWSPEYLTELVGALQRNPKGGLAFGPHGRCDAGGHFFGGGFRLSYGSTVGLIRFSKFLLQTQPRDTNFYGLYRRKYVDSAEIWKSEEFDAGLPMAYAVLARVLLASQYVFVGGSDFLFFKRAHSQSASSTPLPPGSWNLRRKSMMREAQTLYGRQHLPLISALTRIFISLNFIRRFGRRIRSMLISSITHVLRNLPKWIRAVIKRP